MKPSAYIKYLKANTIHAKSILQDFPSIQPQKFDFIQQYRKVLK